MSTSEQLLELALDLGRGLASEDRYQRLLEKTSQVVAADAVCLLGKLGESFVPLAARGLSPDALGRQFRRDEHPRLEAIAHAKHAVEFPFDSQLPDPFDGLLLRDPTALLGLAIACPSRR